MFIGVIVKTCDKFVITLRRCSCTVRRSPRCRSVCLTLSNHSWIIYLWSIL